MLLILIILEIINIESSAICTSNLIQKLEHSFTSQNLAFPYTSQEK